MSKYTVSFYNQGCRLNQAETSTLSQKFTLGDFEVVNFSEKSDVVIVNTCTVTENGDADTRRLVHKINRENETAKIALIGCQAQILKEQLLTLPNVHWVIGNEKKMDVLPIIASSLNENKEPELIVPKIERKSFVEPTVGIDLTHTRANLKIQDGCDFYCAFCVIPFARGPARSREFDDILKEARSLVDAGHKELVITGVNLGTYEHQGKSFLDIIYALEKIDGLHRIRISSIEPTTIPDELIYHMAKSKKLCSYLHIPLQAGTDEILSLMKRKYSLKEFDDFINFVRETVPDVCIGTDVIVGFPGETPELFSHVETYLREAPIDYFHVFSYSERKFARSQKMEGQVSIQEKKRRSKILRDLSVRKRRLFMETLLGKTLPVLFEQEKKGVWQGLTENFMRVKISSDSNLKNTILPIACKSVTDDFLLG